MSELLYSSAYHKPGTYIGQLITASTGSLPEVARIPVMIGSGSRYMLSSNAEVTRAFVYEEALTFTLSSPYTATLEHTALQDQTKAELVRVSDSYVVPENHWYFDSEETIVISEDEYKANESYTLSYQSTDRTVLDPTPVNDIITVRSCGSSPSSNMFVEGKDYYIEISKSEITNTSDGSASTKVAFSDAYDATSLYMTHSDPVATPSTAVGTILIDDYEMSSLGYTSTSYKLDVKKINVEVSYDTTTEVVSTKLISIVVDYTYVTDTFNTTAKQTLTILADGTFTSGYRGIKFALSTTTGNAINGGTATLTSGATTIASYACGDFSAEDVSLSYVDCTAAADISITGNVASNYTFTLTTGKVFFKAKDNRTETLKLVTKGTEEVSLTQTSISEKLTATSVITNSPKLQYNRTYSVYFISGDSTNNKILVRTTYNTQYGSVSFDSQIDATYDSTNSSYTISGSSLDLGDGTTLTISTASGSTIVASDFSSTTSMYVGVLAFSGTATKWYYNSTTQEGGFGTIESATLETELALPGNILLDVNANEMDEGDEVSFTLTNDNVINWNLTLRKTQQFTTSDIYRDVNGTKTGIVGSYYVELSGIPLTGILSVTSGIYATLIANTSYATVSTSSTSYVKPTTSFAIGYEYAGNEPSYGDTYYLTTLHIRPDEYYNKVIFVSGRSEGETLLSPSTPTNDLYVANEIAWDVIGNTSTTVRQIAYIQIKDSDDDGVISPSDVQNAIDALATNFSVTDWVLLGNFDQIGKMLTANQTANDPFEKRENELWVGTPIGTEIGDANTEGSLVYLAKNTLKVYGTDPAHGTRILVASTTATKSVTMDSGNDQTITLDGSFVAWSLACLRSTMLASDSIMRKTLSCFETMEVFDDTEDITLGSSQIIYFSKQGTGIYRVEEDFTVDTYNFEFSLEQITSQRLQVVRRIRNYMDENLIGVTPDTPSAGVVLVTSFLIRALSQLIKEGVISQYQDENGNPRAIDADKDVYATIVDDNPTQYQFGYGFYTKKVIKHLFGTYVVDEDFSSTGLGTST